jgi:hypothetical protein
VVEDHARDDDEDDGGDDVGDDAGDDAGGYSAGVDSGAGGDSAAGSGTYRVRRTRKAAFGWTTSRASTQILGFDKA